MRITELRKEEKYSTPSFPKNFYILCRAWEEHFYLYEDNKMLFQYDITFDRLQIEDFEKFSNEEDTRPFPRSTVVEFRYI